MGSVAPGVRSYGVERTVGGSLGEGVRAAAPPAKRVPGPYVAETFEVHVEDAYVVLDA
jgi:3-phenylpropionate/trans-cinnamate dioxygenase ferredoxin subunit